ncbi:hypothetical protein AYI68_g3601 [Smittium mucronatum]|uniref:Replicase polyprotein 1a n=1 Tax=Smittium mucronatum TaxID=133383 RepID=A0A1R0GZE6_9FUNG|nr:hypothetical protein AYI68_g3601 [Smittium mucronatum]
MKFGLSVFVLPLLSQCAPYGNSNDDSPIINKEPAAIKQTSQVNGDSPKVCKLEESSDNEASTRQVHRPQESHQNREAPYSPQVPPQTGPNEAPIYPLRDRNPNRISLEEGEGIIAPGGFKGILKSNFEYTYPRFYAQCGRSYEATIPAYLKCNMQDFPFNGDYNQGSAIGNENQSQEYKPNNIEGIQKPLYIPQIKPENHINSGVRRPDRDNKEPVLPINTKVCGYILNSLENISSENHKAENLDHKNPDESPCNPVEEEDDDEDYDYYEDDDDEDDDEEEENDDDEDDDEEEENDDDEDDDEEEENDDEEGEKEILPPNKKQ